MRSRPANGGASAADLTKFRAEIGWREFSYHLLFHNPDLATRNYQPKFDAFPGGSDERGAAGLAARAAPAIRIVDAGMRQLWQTGWMHNRVRMITASFLIKHLLVDWRAGEEWFWDTLVDADPGQQRRELAMGGRLGRRCGALFPHLQSGPAGREIRHRRAIMSARFVPELAKLPPDIIHKPWDASAERLAGYGVRLGVTYPRPIVDHDEARTRALSALQATKTKRGLSPYRIDIATDLRRPGASCVSLSSEPASPEMQQPMPWRTAHRIVLPSMSATAGSGGHSATVDIDYDGTPHRSRHRVHRLQRDELPELDGPLRRISASRPRHSEMSFALSARKGGFEWCGRTYKVLDGLFAQRRNLVSPAYLCDAARNFALQPPRGRGSRGRRPGWRSRSETTCTCAAFPTGSGTTISSPWARRSGRCRRSRCWLLPAESFIAFFQNHHLLQWNRPVWRTVKGGSRRYVERMAASLPRPRQARRACHQHREVRRPASSSPTRKANQLTSTR